MHLNINHERSVFSLTVFICAQWPAQEVLSNPFTSLLNVGLDLWVFVKDKGRVFFLLNHLSDFMHEYITEIIYLLTSLHLLF